jgi:hypothetical protein
MSRSQELQDPLKPFDRIMQPDPRHDGSLGTLGGLHAKLDTIRLHAGVPLHVRHLFETGKNLSLYSWFAYRFHPVAQLIGYASLERALKERLARERGADVDAIRVRFSDLMNRAVKEGWLKSERFDVAHHIARAQLREEQTRRMITSGQIGEELVESLEMEEADVLSRAAELDFVDRLAKNVPYIRNHIAHGGPILDGTSASTLRLVAEAINQLFEEPEVKTST